MPLPTIAESPAAFAPLAEAINTIARALNAASGRNGIKVTVSEGKIIFEIADTIKANLTGNVTGNLTGSVTGGSGTFVNLTDNGDTSLAYLYCDNIEVSGSLLTRRTIQVCDGGVTKSMYVLGSATF